MKKEDILLKLENIYKNTNESSLNVLIGELKEDIRLETSYKSNSKTKINAIKKICKRHLKDRPVLGGYSIYDDKYVFTDSYQMYCINPIDMPVKRVGEQTEEEKAKGIDTIPGSYPNVKLLLKPMNYDELVDLNLNDIMYHCKTRNKKDNESVNYELNSKNLSAIVNVEYLKNAIDILGKDLKCSLSTSANRGGISYNLIVLENDEKETGLILPIK